ncbi:peptide chain release factor N(5)-glutamine methyltransferase [Patescibacteria group bacterium]|nr:peptide chain release factor N(5)-glutamine methyltransferase [Patescibacteria group bacterium]
MTISSILSKAQKAGLRSEMEVFLADLLGKDRTFLIAHGEEEIPVSKLSALQLAWVKILEGTPVAYLIHKKEFYGLEFYVDERVLVPRPETERLVDLVIQKAEKLKELGTKEVRVLELGTGSGAIAVAVKKTDQSLIVAASEVSKEALKVAKINAKKLGVEVQFIEADLLDGIEKEAQILVANLPYIGTETNNFVSENVESHEPHVALFGGSDGLRLYAKLFDQISEGGWDFSGIFGELGFSQGEQMLELAGEKLPEFKASLLQDLQGLDRYFVLERK